MASTGGRPPPALPVLLLHRRSRDADGRLLDLVRARYRMDRFSFTVALGARRPMELRS